MLSQKHNYSSSQNPLLIEATLKAIERRRQQESLDPVRFARRCGFLPDSWQAAVMRSSASRQILLASRQSGKSSTTALLLLWTALYKQNSLALAVSPSQRQSIELLRKVRDFLNLLPDASEVDGESTLRLEFANGSRIIALPGSERTVRGYSAVDLLVCDEAARCEDALWYSVSPMLAVSQGKAILLSTPFGRRGFYHSTWMEGGPEWERTKVTAAECPRIAPAWLEKERQQIGEFWFTQEYECSFNDDVSAVFRYEDILAAADGNITPDWSIGNALG